jgi:hypothetical protein
MVVDFAIDRERNGIVLVGNGLRTTVDTDNTQSLVGQD